MKWGKQSTKCIWYQSSVKTKRKMNIYMCMQRTSMEGHCKWKILPPISVNKGCCGHQAITFSCPEMSPVGTQDEACCQALSHCSHPQQCTLNVSWVYSGWMRTGYWPLMAKVHMKGIISMRQVSYIFPYIEKC